MPSGDSQEYKFRDIKWKTSSASEDESASADESTHTAHVIADKDIDLTGLGGGAAGVKSIQIGQDGTKLEGDVILNADSASTGIYAVADGQTIKFDVNGRAENESLLVRDVRDASEKDEKTGEYGKIVARVFATDGFTINKGGAVTFVGTNKTTKATCKTGKITFASASDSNVVITPTADAEGNVTITIGVYYK